MSELLPCPLCGVNPEGILPEVKACTNRRGTPTGEYNVECANCGCSFNIGADTKKMAVAFWNYRPKLSPDYILEHQNEKLRNLVSRLVSQLSDMNRPKVACDFCHAKLTGKLDE